MVDMEKLIDWFGVRVEELINLVEKEKDEEREEQEVS